MNEEPKGEPGAEGKGGAKPESAAGAAGSAGAPAGPDLLAGVDFAALDVIKWPDPRLKKPSEPVTTFGEHLGKLASRMFELMRHYKGVGLAAPQVGLNLRLFVINPTGNPEDDRVYVNPVLSDPDGGDEKEEGCLSLPDINVNIARPTTLKIRAQDLLGQPFEQVATGFITRVWQHENDHLDGRLIIDRMSPVARMTHRKIFKKLEEEYAERQAKKKKK